MSTNEMAEPLNANVDEDDEDEETLRFQGYRKNGFKLVCGHAVSILFLFLPYLLFRWKPGWRVKLFRSRCGLFEADLVLIIDPRGSEYVEDVHKVAVARSFPQRYVGKESHYGVSRDVATALLSSEASTPFHLFFHHKQVKYVWDNTVHTFVKLDAFDSHLKLSSLNREYSGLTSEQQQILQPLHGRNGIEVEVKPYLTLLVEEVLNPFYIFQILSMILWSLDNYVFYASCILIISILSIVATLVETRRQSQALHDMVAQSNNVRVTVKRGKANFLEDIPSDQLVPGDVIAIPPHGCDMSCDAVLISGICIVNESMLTGESTPVTKSAVPPVDTTNDEVYDPETHKRHTLFAGTSVIQTRYYGNSQVLAVVVGTGFNTAKGELVRSIMHPKPLGFKFYQDSIRFVGVLFGIATLGMIYCVYVYVERGTSFGKVVLRCLDIFTIVVPPALPAAMTVGIYYAQGRLKKNKIFCISPQRINICGKLKLVCFDKTGTLTEDGLEFWGVNSALGGTFDTEQNFLADDPKQLMTNCMASCHSLTLIGNKLTGDPLDIKMFEATGWTLEESGEDTSKFDMLMPTVVKPKEKKPIGSGDADELNKFPHEVGIIRQFTFSSSVARMSVITKTLESDRFEVFTKGAPEKVVQLCIPETIPFDFAQKLNELTMKGFRVIGLAHRTLPAGLNWVRIEKMKRYEVERDLTFLGFLIMQNKLKAETTSIIHELKDANIRSVMVTGDNLLTSLSVARNCHMIDTSERVIEVEADNTKIEFLDSEFQTDVMSRIGENGYSVNMEMLSGGGNFHFAMTGNTWANLKAYFPSVLPKILLNGTVFARMAPDQKAQLVEDLQALDYVVSMCGDGANDCGALKAAHVGISLSEAEASVAAPFTSQVPNISCVPAIVKEGRCALVTSFGVFKYMALYSMIQFISVLILYTYKTLLGDTQFLYIDLVITATVAVLMGWTKPYSHLVKKSPPGSLISSSNLFSIISQILLVMVTQLVTLFYLTSQSWYEPLNPKNPDSEIIVCWETTSIFLVSSFQYLILAATFSTGPPYRGRLYSNKPFFAALVLLSTFTIVLTLYPGQTMGSFFQLEQEKNWNFRVVLLAISLFTLLMAVTLENLTLRSKTLKKFLHFLTNKTEPKNKFKRLLQELEPNWPPRFFRKEDVAFS